MALYNPEIIKQYGWQAIGVLQCPEEGTPSFTYTIGLVDRDWPELIITGIRPDYAHHIIVDTIELFNKRGVAPQAGDIIDEVANYPFRFLECDESVFDEWACQAEVYALETGKRDQLRCLQLLWTDKQHIYPDQPGFDESMRKAIPLLGRLPS